VDPVHDDARELANAYAHYRLARIRFLNRLHIPASNRDPIAEFCERLVAVLLGAGLASNRVQAGWDLETPAGERIQVKYLANAGADGSWVNEHVVSFVPGVNRYALRCSPT
jgi:hypothetical protein